MVVLLILWYTMTILEKEPPILEAPREEDNMDEQRQVSEAQKRAHRKYMEKFVEIKVRVTPKKRATIQEHAQTMGESATTFINRAIDNQISHDRDKGPSKARQDASGAGEVYLPSGQRKAQEMAQNGQEEGGT